MGYWRACFSITRPMLTTFGDHTKPNPAVHSDGALVAATVEAVSPLDDTDTPPLFRAERNQRFFCSSPGSRLVCELSGGCPFGPDRMDTRKNARLTQKGRSPPRASGDAGVAKPQQFARTAFQLRNERGSSESDGRQTRLHSQSLDQKPRAHSDHGSPGCRRGDKQRAAREAERSAAKAGPVAKVLEIEKLKLPIARVRRAQFGRSSEKGM